MYRNMEVSNVIETRSSMEGNTQNESNGRNATFRHSLETDGSSEKVKSVCTDESEVAEVTDTVVNECIYPNSVPLKISSSKRISYSEYVGNEEKGCDENIYILPTPLEALEESFLSQSSHDREVSNCGAGERKKNNLDNIVLNTLNNNGKNILSESVRNFNLSSSERNQYSSVVSIRTPNSERNKCNVERISTTRSSALGLNNDFDVLPDKKDSDIFSNDKKSFRNVDKPRTCDEQEIRYLSKSSKMDDSVMSIPREASRIVVRNNVVTKTIFIDEKKNKDSRSGESNTIGYVNGKMGVDVKRTHHHEPILSQGSLPPDKKADVCEVSNCVLYQCLHCSFTHRELKEVSSHVNFCNKRKKDDKQEPEQHWEPPTKARILSQNMKPNLNNSSKSRPSLLPKVQSVVLPPSQIPVTSSTQLLITSSKQVSATSSSQLVITPKTQLVNVSNPQFVISPQIQFSGTPRTVMAITPNSHSTPAVNPQFIISPQFKLPVTSQSTAAGSSSVNSKIIISPPGKIISTTKGQAFVTLQTQSSIISTGQLISSKPQVVTSSQAQFPLPAGAKITLGPQSPVQIVPQAPLAISSQGLSFLPAGAQLLTTKPMQPNAGSTSQLTLLGLGIGTNPAAAPKNIVLLPNLVVNPSPTGKGNETQMHVPIKGQFILQNPTTMSSSVPVQLQNVVYTPQTSTSQSLLRSVRTVSNNSVSSNGIKTSVPSAQPVTSPQILSISKHPTDSTTVPANTTNLKPGDHTNVKEETVDKFICEICDDHLKDLGKLRNHMKCLHAINIHPKMMPSFNCQKCQFCFFTEQGLERHLLGSHALVTTGMQEAADKGKDGGRCPICGWGFQRLLHHVATDHKVLLKPADLSYKCTLCTASFEVYKLFEDHVYAEHRPAISKLVHGNSQISSSEIK